MQRIVLVDGYGDGYCQVLGWMWFDDVGEGGMVVDGFEVFCFYYVCGDVLVLVQCQGYILY